MICSRCKKDVQKVRLLNVGDLLIFKSSWGDTIQELCDHCYDINYEDFERLNRNYIHRKRMEDEPSYLELVNKHQDELEKAFTPTDAKLGINHYKQVCIDWGNRGTAGSKIDEYGCQRI